MIMENHQLLFRKFYVNDQGWSEISWNEDNRWVFNFLEKHFRYSLTFGGGATSKKYNCELVFQTFKKDLRLIVGLNFDSAADLIIFKLKFCK